MGRWSRHLAARFVAWLAVPDGANWLDVGCGTGALTAAICTSASPASVVACDPSQPFIEYARGHQSDARTSFVIAGTDALPSRAGGFDCIASLLALNFFPRPGDAILEMQRIAAKDGVIASCVWDYAGRMEFLRYFWDAAVAEDATAAELDEGRRFPLCRPDALEKLFCDAGLADVASEPIEITTRFTNFADFWNPFLGGTGPAPSYVAKLDSPARDALALRLERSLPREPDGGITLSARAWAVRGVATRGSLTSGT